MNDLFRLSATEAAKNIKGKNFAVTEYVDSCLDRIKKLEPRIHAWASLNRRHALNQALAIDQKIKEGKSVGLLAGIPVGVKDIMNTADFPTEMGSPIWKGFTPGNDARVVFRLRQEDAVIPGKTVTAEFAVHTPGPTHNPRKHGYMTGTSSSGSAAAVAAQMVPLALGTQTAGSTIRPASYCGVYGMKPSFGLIPRTGMLKTTDSLDQVGFFSRTVDDLRLMFDVLRVNGEDHPVSDRALGRNKRETVQKNLWRVGLITDALWVWKHVEPYARDAIVQFGETISRVPNIRVETITLPSEFNDAHNIHETIYNKTLSYYFKGEYEKKRLVSPVMKELMEKGFRISLAAYQRALKKQQRLAALLSKQFDDVDVLLTLATGGEAMKGLAAVDRPDSCLIWTLCWAPTINLPVFTGTLGLPFGAQLVAPRYHDHSLLSLSAKLEEELPIKSPTIP